MDRFLSRLAVWDNNTQLLKQINFPEMPAIEKRYLIFSNDENHARDFLSPARLLFLQNLSEHYAIDMGGDIFTIHQVISSNNMSRRECIFQTLKTAREMIQIFSDSPVKLDG